MAEEAKAEKKRDWYSKSGKKDGKKDGGKKEAKQETTAERHARERKDLHAHHAKARQNLHDQHEADLNGMADRQAQEMGTPGGQPAAGAEMASGGPMGAPPAATQPGTMQ